MKKIREKILLLNDSIQDINENNISEFKKNLSEIINMIVDEIEALQVNQENLEETIKLLDDDISDIQEDLFEEVTLEELEEMDEEYVEITCSSCNKDLFVEKDAINKAGEMPCPFCGNIIKL